MNLRHLTIFKKVCDEGSITQAARQLYMTQPAVSHAISELEEELGTPLFDRLSRRLYLTGAGRILLEKSTRLLAMYEDLTLSARSLEADAPMRLGSTITLANSVLPEAMKRWNALGRFAPARVTIDKAAEIERLLAAGEIDLALLEGVVHLENLTAAPLSSTRLLIVCAPESPFYRSNNLSVSALLDLPLLLRETGSAIRDTFDSALLLHGKKAIPQWISVNSQALIEAVKQGLGVSVLPETIARGALASGLLAELHVNGLELSCINQIAVHKDKVMTAPMENFVEIVKEIFAQAPQSGSMGCL